MGDRSLLTRHCAWLPRHKHRFISLMKRQGGPQLGGGMFVWPHGIHADREGNVWVTDARVPTADEIQKFPGEGNKGSVVVKFSPQGQVLMTLGKPGVKGNPPAA